jgi:hypothetical protein
MKYLAICLLVLGAGLVGCNKGPNTGWECPLCGWGCDENATECMRGGSCGYICFSCGERSLEITQYPSVSAKKLQIQSCDACGAKRDRKGEAEVDGGGYVVLDSDGNGNWTYESDYIIEPWTPKKR